MRISRGVIYSLRAVWRQDRTGSRRRTKGCGGEAPLLISAVSWVIHVRLGCAAPGALRTNGICDRGAGDMTNRGGWRALDTRLLRGASPEQCTAAAGGTRWRARTRGRQDAMTMMSAKAKVLLWVLFSLLPLVGGANVKGSRGVEGDLGHAVGLLQGPDERQPPLTLPEVRDEEQEEDRDPYSTWQALHDPLVVDEMDDHPNSRWTGRSPRSSDPSEPQPKGSAKKKKKKKKADDPEEDTAAGDRRGRNQKRLKQSSKDCRVEKREIRVRDLGLGFDSDEIVLFKFCVGSCQSSRTNYDLALKTLLQNGSLPRRTARKVSSHPCCRPDRYEPVSFMDAQTAWKTIESLSAASCMCMG